MAEEGLIFWHTNKSNFLLFFFTPPDLIVNLPLFISLCLFLPKKKLTDYCDGTTIFFKCEQEVFAKQFALAGDEVEYEIDPYDNIHWKRYPVEK